MKTLFVGLCLSCAPLASGQTEAPVADLLQDAASRPAMRLEEFERFALAANPTLAQANALVKQSGAQARQAGLYPNPSVGYQGEQIRGGDYHGGEQGAFVQQNFVLGGKLGLRRDVYTQQQREDEMGVSEQRYRVLSDIGQSFYSALAAQELVAVRKRLLSLAADAETTSHQLANVGQTDSPDVLQAEVEAEQARMDYEMAQRAFLQRFHILAAIAGKPDLPVSRLDGDFRHPPQIAAEQIADRILKDSPSVKRARQMAIRAQAELKSAMRESIPDLQIRAGVQQNFEALNPTGQSRVGLQAFASAAIALPVFNRNQGNAAAAAAELERSQAEVMRVDLSLRQAVQPLLEGYLSAQAQADRYANEMLPRASRAYDLNLNKYQSMAAAYSQVLVSQRTLFQLQVAYIGALENAWKNAIALQNYALSSGMNAALPSAMTGVANLPNSGGSGSQ